MRQVPLDIVAGSYADETRPFSSQDTVNYLPVFAEQGGTRTPTMLKTPPGLRPFVEVRGTSEDIAKPIGPVRRTHNCEGKLFAVMGQTLYQVTPSGVAIPQGTVPGISRCSMAHNQLATGNQLVTVNGTSGYVLNTQTQVFERITDEGFPGAIKVIFMDGYIVGIEPRRRFAFCSEVADALAYNTLDRFTSEYLPDLLVSLESVQNQLVLFSEGSMEFFENTGATEQPFRSKRISQKRGCAGTFTTAVIDQTVYWLGDDGIFYRLEGYAPRRISTRPIEQAIRGLDWKNAFAETWTDAGHLVVYWTFPDGMTWGYDISSGQWHRRQSYGFNRWRPNTLTYINSEWVAGDFQNGRLWKLDWDYVLEGDDEIISERVTQTLADSQNRMLVSRVELIVDTGQPLTEPTPFPEQPDPPSITGSAPDGVVGSAYSYAYTLSDGTPPYRVTLHSGTIPPGLSIGLDGVLSGTPTESGTYTYTLRNTDSNQLYGEVTDTVFCDALIPWLMAAVFTNSAEIKRSPDGMDWTQNATRINIPPSSYWSPGTRGRLFRWGDQILATTTSNAFGPVAVISNDLGATWEDAGISSLDSPSGDAAKIGGNIYVASTLLSINYTQKIEPDGTVTGTGWAATALAEDGDYLYNTRDIVSNNVFVRDSSGTYIRDAQYNVTGQNPKTTQLCCGNGLLVATWSTNQPTASDSRFHVASSSDQGVTWTQHANPFGDAIGNSDAQTRLCYSEGLGKWLVTFGSRVAVGDSPATLVQSAHVFGQVPRGMDEDGKKFVICGDNQLMERTVDGVNFTPMTVSNTTASSDLDDVVPLGYLDD